MGDPLRPGDGVRLLPEQQTFADAQRARWQGNTMLPYISPMGTGNSVMQLPTTDTYHDILRKRFMIGDSNRNTPVSTTGTAKVPVSPALSGINPGFISAFNGTTAATGSAGTNRRLFSRDNMNKAAVGVSAATPYLSNLLNSIRKPPRPFQPVMNSYVNLAKVNLDNERANVRAGTHVANVSADRSVDANTAESVKAFNRGQEFDRLSSIGERENNANTSINNQQAGLDMQTNFANNEKANEFNSSLVARDIAKQRESSENVANVGNKLVLQQNERSKEKTELAKARVLRSMYGQSGVLARDNAQGEQWRKDGLPDPFGEDYAWLDSKKQDKTDKKAMGGFMKLPGRKIAC